MLPACFCQPTLRGLWAAMPFMLSLHSILLRERPIVRIGITINPFPYFVNRFIGLREKFFYILCCFLLYTRREKMNPLHVKAKKQPVPCFPAYFRASGAGCCAAWL
jgi:hypothetical protein